MAAKGGKVMAERTEHMKEIGRRGGEATKRRGPEHYRKAGRASGTARRMKRTERLSKR